MMTSRPRMAVRVKVKVRKLKRSCHKMPLLIQVHLLVQTLPRTDFNSRNLGTGRPSIQCPACGEYSHWSRSCPYGNFWTTCNNQDHATHMCRAPRPKPSPTICIYCGSTNHRSGNCPNKPWDNREQPCGTPNALKNQQDQLSNTKILGNAPGTATSMGTNTHRHPLQSQPH